MKNANVVAISLQTRTRRDAQEKDNRKQVVNVSAVFVGYHTACI